MPMALDANSNNGSYLLYNDIEAKVIVGGHFTNSFPITRGVKQGCSLNPLLYVLCVEPLANIIRDDPQIKGAYLPSGGQVELSHYADDITGCLADLHSVKKNLNVVDEFGKASGPKLNKYMQVLKILIMRTGSHVAITLISKFKMP